MAGGLWPGSEREEYARGGDGAGTRSRTRDLLITSQLLYQLSYTGKEGGHYSHANLCVNH